MGILQRLQRWRDDDLKTCFLTEMPTFFGSHGSCGGPHLSQQVHILRALSLRCQTQSGHDLEEMIIRLEITKFVKMEKKVICSWNWRQTYNILWKHKRRLVLMSVCPVHQNQWTNTLVVTKQKIKIKSNHYWFKTKATQQDSNFMILQMELCFKWFFFGTRGFLVIHMWKKEGNWIPWFSAKEKSCMP